jgi:hypothetical protein
MSRLLAALALLSAACGPRRPSPRHARSSVRSAPPTPRRRISRSTPATSHRAEGIQGRAARDSLFLARSRLEQEGRLHQGHRGCDRSYPAAAEPGGLQSARLGLLRQRRVRHRDRRFRRCAEARTAERDHLPQPRQRLSGVRAEVVSTTKNKQVPWSNSSLLGEVYLAEK